VILTDVNVLVYAFREDAPRHGDFRAWLSKRVSSAEPFGLSELVLSGVVRVLTHPAVFNPPTPMEKAIAFVDALRARRNSVVLTPGPRHWEVFRDLCLGGGVRGNLVPDAYHAALAIEHGCEWQTTDRDFARFAGLRWRHPLERDDP
jgi:toxin-antitoxin system PIN domain toxin